MSSERTLSADLTHSLTTELQAKDVINVAIIGHGLIGQAIERLFNHQSNQSFSTQYRVSTYDIKGDAQILINVPEDYERAVIDNDIVICCTPFHVNKTIAQHCFRHSKPYFDLTEDNEKADWVREGGALNGCPVMPQCGLAPGVVSIIAAGLAGKFDKVNSIDIRVGALPLNAHNEMKYYLSWSPDGLINEYNRPCKAKKDGEFILLQPLEGLETIIINGVEHEAFNTSGGLGSLATNPNFADVPNMTYKTIRYKGHRDKMKFVFEDLGLRHHQQQLVDLFKQNVPYIDRDIVMIYIQVVGEIKGKTQVRQYVHRVYGDSSFPAISQTTAAGVCTAVEWFVRRAPKPVVLYNEGINIAELCQNPYWDVYRVYDEKFGQTAGGIGS